VVVVVSALILCSRLADQASHPICVLTPLAVIICFSLRAPRSTYILSLMLVAYHGPGQLFSLYLLCLYWVSV
jgi:hypothetical protein